MDDIWNPELGICGMMHVVLYAWMKALKCNILVANVLDTSDNEWRKEMRNTALSKPVICRC